MSDKLPEGHTCRCGKFHKYPAYVYAHWDIPLVHECDQCHTEYGILEGVAKPGDFPEPTPKQE